MDAFIKVWEFFNSKKTAIGAFMFALSDFADAMGYPEVAGPVRNIAYAFTGTGLTHKAAKAIK